MIDTMFHDMNLAVNRMDTVLVRSHALFDAFFIRRAILNNVDTDVLFATVEALRSLFEYDIFVAHGRLDHLCGGHGWSVRLDLLLVLGLLGGKNRSVNME